MLPAPTAPTNQATPGDEPPNEQPISYHKRENLPVQPQYP